MKAVISLGGSIVASPNINRQFISSYARMVLELREEGIHIATVVGGGKIAREYIEVAREWGSDEDFCDEIGILATRMNAHLLVSALGSRANKRIPQRVEEVDESRIVVMGGTVPGHTTDAVSAQLARKIGASVFINASNVDGIYESDPRLDPEAGRIDKIKASELCSLLEEKHRAGITTILDTKALELVLKEGIRTVVLRGTDLENMERALKGKKFRGTEVLPQ